MTYVVQLRGDDDGARHLPLVVLPVHDARTRRNGELGRRRVPVATVVQAQQGCVGEEQSARRRAAGTILREVGRASAAIVVHASVGQGGVYARWTPARG
eukprot:COSAG02_NODE_3845_length_6153_cov_3.206640_4_plen_99_part_00